MTSSLPCGMNGQYEKCEWIMKDEDMDHHPMGNSGRSHCPLSILKCIPQKIEGMDRCKRICEEVLVVNRPQGSMQFCLREKAFIKEKGPSQPLPPIHKKSV